MPLRYWRTFACGLALGIGGLAVCAEECIRGGAPAAMDSRKAKNNTNSEPPVVAGVPGNGVAVLPPPPLPDLKDSEPPQLVLPLVQPTIVIPSVTPPVVQTQATEPPAPIPMTPKSSDPPSLPTPPPPIGLGVPNFPPVPTGLPLPTGLPPSPPSTPVAPKFDIPPAPLDACPTKPLPTTPPVPTAPIPPPPAIPAHTVSNPKPAAPATQYKVFVRMGGTGQPRFEIRDGDQLLLKVTCEQIELHGAQDGVTALPGLSAIGKVKFHGSGLDGTCDQLSIISAKGEVSLKGSVHLSCYRGTTGSQVVAESVMFQLARTGETTAKSKPSSSGVVPASLP